MHMRLSFEAVQCFFKLTNLCDSLHLITLHGRVCLVFDVLEVPLIARDKTQLEK